MISLKYYASELNENLTHVTHSDDYFTRHMRCKLYNSKNVEVGTLTTQNHHYIENNIHYVSANSTIRINNVGSFIYHLVFQSNNGYLSRMVKTIPHFANGQFSNKRLVVRVGPKEGTSGDLSNVRYLNINVFV
jgi:hypothetical protein